MSFRKATLDDVEAIGMIYDAIHTQEENGLTQIGWKRTVYPTRKTALEAIRDHGDMFVELDENGDIVAAGRINKDQVPEYSKAHWEHDTPDERVMVLHTLVVDPQKGGHGYGTKFVDYYESYALENDCPYLRMDTNAKNTRARQLYNRLGFKERGVIPCVFNGIEGVQLICLEKSLIQ